MMKALRASARAAVHATWWGDATARRDSICSGAIRPAQRVALFQNKERRERERERDRESVRESDQRESDGERYGE